MDQIISALANNKNIRVMVADVTELVKTAQVRHELFPTAVAALGRTMAIASIMAFQLKKEDEMVSIRIAGDGPLELIRVDAKKNGDTVGFVGNPFVNMINEETHKLDVGAAIGKGQLSVSRNYHLKHEFTSSVDLVSGEIAEDFAYYSQLIPACFSRLGTGNAARGITSPIHTDTFDVDEDCLLGGMGLMGWLAVQELGA